MKLMVGIVRATCLEKIVKELQNIEIRNMTITEVKGIGEQVTLFNAYAIHKVLLIVVPDEKVDEVSKVILASARTGAAGDGVITVCPVDSMIKIRTAEKFV